MVNNGFYSMANMPHAFKDRDVQRIIKAARSAGLDPVEVEVDPKTGRIRVVGSKAAVASSEPAADPLSDWMTRHADQA